MLSITVLIPSITFVTTVFILSKASPADNVIVFQIFIITFFAPSIINVIPLITFCTPFFIVSVFNVNIPTMTWNTPDIVVLMPSNIPDTAVFIFSKTDFMLSKNI